VLIKEYNSHIKKHTTGESPESTPPPPPIRKKSELPPAAPPVQLHSNDLIKAKRDLKNSLTNFIEELNKDKKNI